MNKMQSQGFIALLLSFFIAFILTVLPMPGWTVWFRPEWVPLVLIYWVVAVPHRVGLGWAWSLGLLLDVLTGAVLGIHAFSLMLVAFIAVKLHHQMRVFPVFQQMLCVLGLLVMYQLSYMILHSLVGEVSPHKSWVFISAIVSSLLWPWLYVVLREGRRKFGVA